MTECYTMSCYDCIHCDRCSDFESGFSAHCAGVSKCKHFRNKADFVEVVRCKDCIHSKESPMRIICQRYGRDVNENGYCSYGEMEKNE